MKKKPERVAVVSKRIKNDPNTFWQNRVVHGAFDIHFYSITSREQKPSSKLNIIFIFQQIMKQLTITRLTKSRVEREYIFVCKSTFIDFIITTTELLRINTTYVYRSLFHFSLKISVLHKFYPHQFLIAQLENSQKLRLIWLSHLSFHQTPLLYSSAIGFSPAYFFTLRVFIYFALIG